ncbi:MAG: methylmalonyl-CoA mutase family protein [Bacteroidetes bacterium]|nr:methylmalonyl-CoA mutase family protein [Bacteroidota bacterium]
MRESLNLLNYFPPVQDNEWKNLLPEDFNWRPIEGIEIQPYYRHNASNPGHTFDRRQWLICANVNLPDSTAAQDAGAEALWVLLDEPVVSPEQLPAVELPLFFSGAKISPELIKILQSQTVNKALDSCSLRGAITLPEQYSAISAMEIAEATGLWTQVINLEKWHDYGATHVQELAFGLAQLSDLMAELAPNCTAKHLYFQVPVGERYLLDLARLRALRLGASEVLRAYNAHTHNIHIVGVPSHRYESVLDSDTHLIRQTLQYAAAITGGCDVIVSPGIGHSLRILHILRHEGKLGSVADPAAGSWMIEHLTEALGLASWKLFQTIESKGGLRKSQSWIEKEIQRVDTRRRTDVSSGKDIIVGANAFLSEQIKETAPQKKSLVASLETIRIRTKHLGTPARVRIHGSYNPWLDRLLNLCNCSIEGNGSDSIDLTITETDKGFQIQNQQCGQALVKPGDPLPDAADQLLLLLE